MPAENTLFKMMSHLIISYLATAFLIYRFIDVQSDPFKSDLVCKVYGNFFVKFC